MSAVALYDLHPSPNNVKVRLALGYKRIPYERRGVHPAERSELIARSGQPLTPVLVHGAAVLFDSSAILRYLEANVAREPRIFSESADVMRAIEGWEQRTRGGGFGAPVGICFSQYFGERDEAKLAEAKELFAERCREVERALTPAGFLVGDALSAADLCVVPLLCYGGSCESLLAGNGAEIARFLASALRIPDDCPRTRAYVESVMSHDR